MNENKRGGEGGKISSDHTVAGSSVLKGSRHILQESSEPSSKAPEDNGAEVGSMSDRGGGGEEEEEVKLSIDGCKVKEETLWRRRRGRRQRRKEP